MNSSCKLGVAVGLISLACSLAPGQVNPDPKSTAQKLVDQCAGIKAGDRVLISGTPHHQALLEEIAVTCRKVGAFPFITVSSEQLERRMIDEVPAKFDGQTNELGLKLADVFTASINIDSTETEGLLAGVDPARLAARNQAEQPVMEAMLKSHTRTVSLGNGLFPTATTAKHQGVTLEQLTTIFWSGVNTDYSKLRNTGQMVKDALAKNGEVHITNPNGTDLWFTIRSHKILVSDGSISPEAAESGGPGASVWLPAGEVYTTPVPRSAHGKAVIDRLVYQGKEITGLTLTFESGRLTSMTAKTNLEALKPLYDASGEGKDELSLLDIGINEGMQIPEGVKLLNWVPAGMVTIGMGDNTWAGGTNKSNFNFGAFMPGCTLTLDDKTLVEKGTLKP